MARGQNQDQNQPFKRNHVLLEEQKKVDTLLEETENKMLEVFSFVKDKVENGQQVTEDDRSKIKSVSRQFRQLDEKAAVLATLIGPSERDTSEIDKQLDTLTPLIRQVMDEDPEIKKAKEERAVALEERKNEEKAALAQKVKLHDNLSFSSYYDENYADGPRWMIEIEEDGLQVVLPTEAEDPDDLVSARRAAWEVMAENTMPLVYPGQEPFTTPSLVYDENTDQYSIHFPCLKCSGYHLKTPKSGKKYMLQAMQLSNVKDQDNWERIINAQARLDFDRLRKAIEQSAEQNEEACFGCLSDEIRDGTRELPNSPMSWFDVRANEWKLHYPLDEENSVELPLELPFLAPPQVVQESIKEILQPEGFSDDDNDEWQDIWDEDDENPDDSSPAW